MPFLAITSAFLSLDEPTLMDLFDLKSGIKSRSGTGTLTFHSTTYYSSLGGNVSAIVESFNLSTKFDFPILVHVTRQT